MTFRWYGPQDPVTLEKIRQIPLVRGVVTAVYSIPAGQAWPMEEIRSLRETVHSAGLEMEVIESVPVPEEIKLGAPAREAQIEQYCVTIRRLGEAGVKVVCYNFMPVFDWTRSDLRFALPDGSTCLAYSRDVIEEMDPAAQTLSLPGWDESYTKAQLRDLLQAYRSVSPRQLMENLCYFLRRVIPVCEESGVQMAIHPDDPPWGLFGLPRVVTGEEGIDYLLHAVDSPCNGITLCTGSLGASPENDLPHMAAKYAAMGRVSFVHARNIRRTQEGFHESAHPTVCGSLDLYAVLKALHENGFDGYIRPDHGRDIWGENGRPGYGLYDRALGACYLNGLWEAICRA